MDEQVKAERRVWGDWVALDSKPAATTRMSAVWRVRKTGEEASGPFALKELRYDKAEGSTAFERLVREAEVLKKLSNPGIIGLVDHGSSMDGGKGRPYYVMPWAQTTLAKAVGHYKGQIELVLQLAGDLARAMEAAHSEQVIHRDLKPDNILFLGEELRPVVADFGICYLEDDERLTHTEAGTVGTEDFVAPELKGGGVSQAVTPAADVYSLGKTVYFAVTGGKSLFRELLDDPRYDPLVDSTDPRMSHLKSLIRSMVEVSLTSRPATMGECLGLIDRVRQNVVAGLPYSPGMYDRNRAPVEQFKAILSMLQGVQSQQTIDTMLDSLREAEKRVDDEAVRLGQVPGMLTRQGGAPIETAKQGIAATAEELLAVGVALLKANEMDGFRELLATLRGFVKTPEWVGDPGRRWLLPPTGAVVAGVLGALAWHRRRHEALGLLVDLHLEDAHRWIHHYVLGEGSRMVPPTAQAIVKASKVIAFAEPQLEGALDESLSAFYGLVVLKALIKLPPADLDQWTTGTHNDLPTPWFPGYHFPTVTWTSRMPSAFIKHPHLEEQVSQAVFGVPPAKFRSEAKRVSPALVRAVKKVAWGETRMITWGIHSVGNGWGEWCGYSTELE